jgi:menaquinone-dependent protoporphyrinogen IX oxidase
MKTVIVYHSFSGVTRGLAERVRTACGGDLVEVRPLQPYSKVTAYTLGCLRARGGKPDAVEPGVIDVSGYDRIVLGTPVWAWRPTPVILGAVEALAGAEGKSAVIYATCGAQSGETLPQLREALAAKGVEVIGEFSFQMQEVNDSEKAGALIARVTAGDAAPTQVGG